MEYLRSKRYIRPFSTQKALFPTTEHRHSPFREADLHLLGGLLPFQGAVPKAEWKYKRLSGNAIPPFRGRVYLGTSPVKRR